MTFYPSSVSNLRIERIRHQSGSSKIRILWLLRDRQRSTVRKQQRRPNALKRSSSWRRNQLLDLSGSKYSPLTRKESTTSSMQMDCQLTHLNLKEQVNLKKRSSVRLSVTESANFRRSRKESTRNGCKHSKPRKQSQHKQRHLQPKQAPTGPLRLILKSTPQRKRRNNECQEQTNKYN